MEGERVERERVTATAETGALLLRARVAEAARTESAGQVSRALAEIRRLRGQLTAGDALVVRARRALVALADFGSDRELAEVRNLLVGIDAWREEVRDGR